MLRAVTPGGHPFITVSWLVGVAMAALAFVAAILGASAVAAVLALAALAVFVAGSVAYRQRLRRFTAQEQQALQRWSEECRLKEPAQATAAPASRGSTGRG